LGYSWAHPAIRKALWGVAAAWARVGRPVGAICQGALGKQPEHCNTQIGVWFLLIALLNCQTEKHFFHKQTSFSTTQLRFKM